MTKRLTEAEKVAKKIVDMINDLTLDLDEVGSSIAHYARKVSLNRLKVILESAEYEIEQAHNRHYNNYD